MEEFILVILNYCFCCSLNFGSISFSAWVKLYKPKKHSLGMCFALCLRSENILTVSFGYDFQILKLTSVLSFARGI